MTVYTSKGLADHCGVSLRTFAEHVRQNVCGVREARAKVPGLQGYSYDAQKCRKYIAHMGARKREPEIHIAV